MNRKIKNRPDRKVPVRGYEPSSYEEYMVHEIAKHVEDTDMRPLLKVLRRSGLGVIEAAFQEFRNLEDVVPFTNKPGFFMHLIRKRLRGGGATD